MVGGGPVWTEGNLNTPFIFLNAGAEKTAAAAWIGERPARSPEPCACKVLPETSPPTPG
jgi:hypothetical protein